MRALPIDNLISNVRIPSLNEGLDRVEVKVQELSKRKSEKFKIKLLKIVTIGSLLLFIVAYNITPDMPNYNNEAPIGLASK